MRDPFELSKNMRVPGQARRQVKQGLKMADKMGTQARQQMAMNAATGKSPLGQTKVRRIARPAKEVAGQPK